MRRSEIDHGRSEARETQDLFGLLFMRRSLPKTVKANFVTVGALHTFLNLETIPQIIRGYKAQQNLLGATYHTKYLVQ